MGKNVKADKPKTERNREVYSPAKIDARIRNALTKCMETHGDRYDYTHFAEDYVNAKTKVRIICKKHGIFEQSPDSHRAGSGCQECNKERKSGVENEMRKSQETFLSECFAVHGDKFDYSKVEYKNMVTDIIIICKEHGEFMQRPDHHLNSLFACPACNAENTGERNRVVLTHEYKERQSQLHQEYLDSLDRGIETYHAIDPEEINMNEWHVLKF